MWFVGIIECCECDINAVGARVFPIDAAAAMLEKKGLPVGVESQDAREQKKISCRQKVKLDLVLKKESLCSRIFPTRQFHVKIKRTENQTFRKLHNPGGGMRTSYGQFIQYSEFEQSEKCRVVMLAVFIFFLRGKNRICSDSVNDIVLKREEIWEREAEPFLA